LGRPTRDVAWLAALVYFTQGALGIAGIALPLYLRALGWSIGEITTVVSIVAFPWVLKVIYGLLSDCVPLFGYRRKSYLVLFAVIASAGWVCLVIFPAGKAWIMIALILANVGFAATDVITDGLIVEHSRGYSSHIYQSIAWGSRSVGAIVSGVTGGWLAAHWEPAHVFLLTALLPFIVFLIAFRIHDHKVTHRPFVSAVEPFKQCLRLLLVPNMKWFILVLVIATISQSFAIPFFFYMKESLGFKETFLGLLASIAWSGAAIGSFLYAKWLSKVNLKLILTWSIVINSVNILGTLLIVNVPSAAVVVFIGGVMGCITLLPIMSASAILTHHSGVEGSLFAILMSIFNFSQIVFGFLGGKLFPVVGLWPLIVGSSLLSLTALFPLHKIQFNPTEPQPAAEVSP